MDVENENKGFAAYWMEGIFEPLYMHSSIKNNNSTRRAALCLVRSTKLKEKVTPESLLF